MKVLVLGGTGSIGAPVVRELVGAGHQVLGLARSAAASQALVQLGAEPLAGDLRRSAVWVQRLPPLQGVVLAAGTFTADEAEVDRGVLDALLPWLSAQGGARLVYTGGCWLYGESDAASLSELTPYEPQLPCAWTLPHIERVLGTPRVQALVIHPAMVYEAAGGVFARFLADARARRPIRVVRGLQVSWPLVHREDLARLYRLVLEQGRSGESYLGSAIDGLSVGRIAQAFARRFGLPPPGYEVIPEDEIVAELGAWARGYGRSQRLSGAKARRELGWDPLHLDPEAEIAALP